MRYRDHDPRALNEIAEIVADEIYGRNRDYEHAPLSLRYGIAAKVLEKLPAVGWVDTGMPVNDGEQIQVIGTSGNRGDDTWTLTVMRITDPTHEAAQTEETT